MTGVARTRAELAEARDKATGRVAAVLTMGALHAGHAALIAEARKRADYVLVTVFVNPLQFGEAADLDRYPRTLDTDVDLAASHGADAVFAPPPEVVYPTGAPLVRIEPGLSGDVLEGASRPGHFAGVLTVVAKLFALIRPDVACFGEKDFQQLALVRRMVADLDLGAEIVGVPTVRDPDGLALSSRNVNLSPSERERALALPRALRAGAAHHDPDGVRRAARAVLDVAPGVDLDYLALTGPDLDLEPGPGEARLLVAARVGTTRLIDNVPLTLRLSKTGA